MSAPRPAGRRRARGDRGAYTLLFAFASVAVITMVALVIDIGQLASRTATNQSVADLAALAAGKNLGIGNYSGACQDAVNYINANASDFTGVTASTFCAQAGNNVASTVCNGGGLSEAMPSSTVGKYTISVHVPVPASEIQDAQYSTGVNDASPCERMRVIISTTEPTFFASIVGVNTVTSTRSATVRAKQGSTGPLAPALWLLDPTGCTSLSVGGGSKVTVGQIAQVSPAKDAIPGVVAVESNGSTCASNQDTISVSGSGSTLQAVPTSGTAAGTVRLVALPAGSALCVDPACNAADVSGGRLSPQPINGTPTTRAPVDWKYNCKTTYPAYHGVAIAPCPNTTTTAPYIDQLGTTIGGSGLPSGYSRFSTISPTCSPTVVVVPVGNWLVDCPTLTIGNGNSVTFLGGNVVFDGGLSMTGGSLSFNTLNPLTLSSACAPATFVATTCFASSSSAAAFIYSRAGDWNITGGSLTLNHVMHYQANGFLKVTTKTPPTWLAPTDGPFADLSTWSEKSTSQFTFTGGTGVMMSGTFFTPEAAPFGLAGGGTWGQQSAQFISFQVAISGGATAAFVPDPQHAVDIPPTSGFLIR